MKLTYDAIVVGGGHAGLEAALALATLKEETLLLTLNIKKMGNMPCNPSIGGSAKGIVVREIDALGGYMGIGADHNYLQMKMLNTSKGPGVQCLRCQADKLTYPSYMQNIALHKEHLEVSEGMVTDLLYEGNEIQGVKLNDGTEIHSKVVILTTGTYLEAQILRGHEITDEGPDSESSAHGLSASLEKMGINLLRLKTGTPQRIKKSSIDYELLEPQYGTEGNLAFSTETTEFVPLSSQVPCYLTYTNDKTHAIIREHLHESAMYGGVVKGVGPRYCPSIEDKVVRFSDKPRHQLFLEPESLYNDSIYLQGFSTSMPPNVQDLMVHSLVGLEHAEILKYAYAIEYDAIEPLQFDNSLMLKAYHGLFGAGQILGTSGYEEAASLGLVAGINAHQYLHHLEPFVMGRDESYIGVMIDDLVTKGTKEPYRLMSSRAEYRLLIRSDNAHLRLTAKAFKLGMISEERYQRFEEKEKEISEARVLLETSFVRVNPLLTTYLETLGFAEPEGSTKLIDILKRQKVSYQKLCESCDDLKKLSDGGAKELEIRIKYEGYILQELHEAMKMKSLEEMIIPPSFDFECLEGLRLEARDKLKKVRPTSIGMASRIPGVNPADINVLLLLIKKGGHHGI